MSSPFASAADVVRRILQAPDHPDEADRLSVELALEASEGLQPAMKILAAFMIVFQGDTEKERKWLLTEHSLLGEEQPVNAGKNDILLAIQAEIDQQST